MTAGNPVESLYAAFLMQCGSTTSLSIDEYCARHIDHCNELKQLHEAYQRWRPALERIATAATACPPASDLDDNNALLLAYLQKATGRHARYDIESEVGRGGMGAVFRVWDRELRRNLAMKVRKPQAEQDAADASRSLGKFLEEAQITSQLDHPGIVPVHELGLTADEEVYFTMRLVKGEDLRCIFEHVAAQRHGWTMGRALGVLLKVCEAMSYAHDKGVVHRDLKPSNIMVGRYGEVHVMDWGLARTSNSSNEPAARLDPSVSRSVRTAMRDTRENTPGSPLVTMDGDVVGTPSYMPPEQARGDLQAIGPRSDVYSVGAMLYHLLAVSKIEMPYVPKGTRISSFTVLNMALAGPPQSLTELAPNAPPELIAICQKAMSRDPDSRHANMSELAEELRSWIEGRMESDRASLFELSHLPPSLVFLYVGALIAMLGAWVATTIAWDAMGTGTRSLFTASVVGMLSYAGNRFWERGDYRRAHAAILGALLTLPAAIFCALHLAPYFDSLQVNEAQLDLELSKFKPFERTEKPEPGDPFSVAYAERQGRLDDMVTLMAICSLAAATWLSRRTGAALYNWFVILFGMVAWWMSAIQFGWRSLESHHQLEALTPFPWIAMGLGLLSEHRGRSDLSRPLLVLGFLFAVGMWIPYASSRYPMQYLWDSPERDLQQWSFVLGGAMSLGIGFIAQRLDTKLLRSYSTLPYLLSPSAVLVSLSILVDRKRVLCEGLLPTACLVFVLLAIALQRKNLLYAGSFYLSIAVFQISNNHFEKEWAWPMTLVAMGFALGAASFSLRRFDDTARRPAT